MPSTILSIQSHVAYGYVGNRAATFPLQRMGCEVIAINTVQFSNHTGYGAWGGDVLSPEHVARVLDGLATRGVLAQCGGVLSGYLGDPAMGAVVLSAVERVKALNPSAVYCCDPVMGDVGRGFFVAAAIPPFFSQQAVSRADILTPNQFELESLTGQPVSTLETALTATAALRGQGVKVVLVTSLTRDGASSDVIEMLADGPAGAWLIATQRRPLDPAPNGAGDMTAALFLAHYLAEGAIPAALERTAAAIDKVFGETACRKTRELQIIAAQDAFISPDRPFQAQQVR